METATVPSFDEAIKAAVASAQKEVGSGAEVKPEPEKPAEAEPEEKPAEKVEAKPETEPTKPAEKAEPEKPEAKPEEEEEELFRLSSEELAEIDKDPRLKKAYKSMLRDYRKKTAEVAENRKKIADREGILEAMAADPDMAVKALAAIRGFEIVEPKKAIKEKSETDLAFEGLEASIGKEGAALLKPVFEGVVKNAVEAAIAARVTPIEAQAAELIKNMQAQGIASNLAQFKAEIAERGDEWNDEIEEEMAGLVGKFAPSPETKFDEYLDTLYNVVAAKRLRAQTTKDKIARLKAAADKQEPNKAARPAADGERSITRDMPHGDAVALAVELAQRELRSR